MDMNRADLLGDSLASGAGALDFLARAAST